MARGGCKKCQSKDPEVMMLSKVMTITVYCCQGIPLHPFGGVSEGFVRGSYWWWGQIPGGWIT